MTKSELIARLAGRYPQLVAKDAEFAVKTLKKFLAEGGKQVPAVRRKEAEAAVSTQQRRIASVTIHATVDGLVLRVDGIAVGKTPLPAPLELKAGAHFLSASVEGYRPWDQPLDLAGGEKRDLEIRLERVEAVDAICRVSDPQLSRVRHLPIQADAPPPPSVPAITCP